jgi:chaperone required for assembly of F1-ATPase
LDGRVLKTPGRKPLSLPNMDLAIAVAAEWDAQTDTRNGIQPVNMPMMSLASTAIDQVQDDPQTTIDTCVKYLPTDTALFLTQDYDRILLQQQKERFDPVVAKLNEELNLQLRTTQSMAGRISHPEETVETVRKLLNKMVSASDIQQNLLPRMYF